MSSNKVTELVRESESGVYLNTNRSAIEQAKMQKKIRKQKRLKDESLLQRINSLEGDISEIKDLLKSILLGNKDNGATN